MKIAILGATGLIGSTIMNEALERGHQLVAVARKPPEKKHSNLSFKSFDLLDDTKLTDVFGDAQVVISAISGRVKGNHDILAKTAKRLLEDLPQTSASRLLWVGGAGSLEVAPGITVLSDPNFPADYKDEAIAQGQALDVFRASSSEISWLFVSPAALIAPGERTGKYRIGGDELLVDDEGNSKISAEDYAVAMIDEIELKTTKNTRIGVAY